MGIASSGLISGINSDQLISQLMQLESAPIKIIQTKQKDYQLKIASFLDISSKLSSFKSALDALNSSSKFNVKNASVTKSPDGDDLLTVSASSSAGAGSHSIKVSQLASASTKASQGWADQNTTAISSSSGSFKFKVGAGGAETSISVSTTMTLQGLRDAINSISSDGVTASIINDGTGSNPYRLVLTADNTGSSNTVYITSNVTDLDFTNKKIEDAYAVTTNTYSGNIVSNSGNNYTGTTNKTFLAEISTAGATGTAKYKYSTDGGITWASSGTEYSTGYTIVADSNDKIVFNDGVDHTITLTAQATPYSGESLALEIETRMEAASAGADYTVTYNSTTGKFSILNKDVITNPASITLKWSNGATTAEGILGFANTADITINKGETNTSDTLSGLYIDGAAVSNITNEGVKLLLTASGTFAVGDRFTVDVFNPEMQTAKDAVITLDNATITKSSNTITDALQGVTMNLLKTDTSAVTLTVSSDTSTAKSSINSFVEAYNTIMKAINDQLTYNTSTKKKNPLLGDATLLEIRRKIANTVTGTVPGLSSSGYTNLSQIGITSDSTTGKLALDDTKLSAALSADPTAVSKLFIGTATATNAAVSYVSKTSKTKAGTYSISVSTAPEKANLGGTDDSAAINLSSNGLTAEETLTFMYAKDYTETTPDYTAFNVTLAAGSKINTIVNELNSSFATNEVGLSASNDNGKLEITSTDYGADIWFQATTNRAGDGLATWQIWNSIATRYDAGVDIVGYINNHKAEGLGNILTATSGFDEDGLKISIDSNLTGGFGTIAISSGISDRLSSSMATYTDSTSGLIIKKTDSIQKTIDNLTAQQKRIEDRLTEKQKRLQGQFARLEVLLAKYNSTSQYLTGQLEGLSKNWVMNG